MGLVRLSSESWRAVLTARGVRIGLPPIRFSNNRSRLCYQDFTRRGIAASGPAESVHARKAISASGVAAQPEQRYRRFALTPAI
jgi:hypothetical protein